MTCRFKLPFHAFGGRSSYGVLSSIMYNHRCINHPTKYYEKVLRKAINRPGTDEDAVKQVIVTRAHEVDLKEIKEQYYKRNSVTLDHVVAKDTSGDYMDFLLTLLGKKD